MIDYFKNKNALPIPWIESPFFYSLLSNSNLNKNEKEMCIQYHENGYLIIDLNLKETIINSIIKDMHNALSEEETRYHAEHFQYTPSKRIFQLWNKSQSIAKLCINKKVLKTLTLLYGKEPFPFSTINFFKGSNQPLHSDVIHFHSTPPLWMAGVWVALEDVDEANGSLKIVPGSHKWKIWEYDDLGYKHPDQIKDGERVLYRQYEDFLSKLVEEKQAKTKIVKMKKGQALIWSANLLHGGSNVKGLTDLEKTRYTQANHYFFKGCERYYHPMYTVKNKGLFAKKWCDENNNIKTFLESNNKKEKEV